MEIIIHIATNSIPKNIANNIIKRAKSVKTEANKVAVSSILQGKDKFNNKGKEVKTHLQHTCSTKSLPLITQWTGEQQPIRNFIGFLENGYPNFDIYRNESYTHLIDEANDRDKLSDSFFPDINFDNSNKNCLFIFI